MIKIKNKPTKELEMEESKTVQEIADMFNVTPPAVRYWIKNGLPTTKRREIGKKEHTVIIPSDVYTHLGIEEIK